MGDSLLRVALRWLAHPVSLVAIGVMVLNDHVLKQAYGTWWTGKLSDVAGLIFFPALVAVVFAAARPQRVDSARLAFGAVSLTGIGFAFVKTTAVGAATASAVLTTLAGPLLAGPLLAGPLLDGPSIIRADATDLLALPALGLAAWVGLGAARREGTARGTLGVQRTGRARRALTVAAVPIALLASVATGVSENSHARVVTDDAGAWRGQVKDAYNYGGDAYYTPTGAGWELFYENDAIGPTTDAEPPVLPDREQTEDCVPSNPTVCFRAMMDTTGVEKSADGGVTWRVDWELSPAQVDTLERAYGERSHDFETHGVGVVEVAGGYVVVAGNGTDGFAVRGVDGEWERVGFAGMDCCTWLKTADFDTVDKLPPVHAYPVGFLMGIGLSTLALPFLAAALRWRRGSQFHVGASIAGGVAYVVGAFLGVFVLVMNSSYGTMTRGEPGLDMLVFIPLGGMAMAVVVVALASWGLLRRGAVLATLGGWFAGTLVAGFTASVAEVAGVRSAWLQAGAGVIALAALYAVYVPLMRRWTTWSRARGVATGAPEWTRLDAMVLGGIGPGKTPTPVPQVVYQAGFSAGEYPSREQLELSLGRLAASRLVKISDFVWFRTTREGQALVRRASRGGTSENLPDALLSALRGVPCKEGRVRISQE